MTPTGQSSVRTPYLVKTRNHGRHSLSKTTRKHPTLLIIMPYFSRDPLAYTPAPVAEERKTYLFLIPDELSEFERAVLESTTTKMAANGLVFVADVRQKETELVDDVFYQPFCIDRLPELPSLEAVIVMNDELLAMLAARHYPTARLFTLTASHDSEEIHTMHEAPGTFACQR